MRRDLLSAARVLVLPTIALAVVVAFAPGRVTLAVRIFALVLCGAALVVLLAALRRAYTPAAPLRRTPRHRRRGGRDVPGTLARLEQETALGVAGAFELHHLLRPRVRGIASELLAARHGVDLDGAPQRSRELLGDEAFGLVRADRPRPEDRLARGLPINELHRVVESLERL